MGLAKFEALMKKKNNVVIRDTKYILRSINYPGILMDSKRRHTGNSVQSKT